METAGAASAMVGGITDAELLLILALILACVQFLYRVWDKKDNKLILDAMAARHNAMLEIMNTNNTAVLVSIKAVTESFTPHLEQGKRTFGILKDLKGMHDIRDDDGRPLWYMPKEIIETQRELTRLTHTVATTQKHIARIIEKQDTAIQAGHEKIEAMLIAHQDICKNQYHQLKENMS